MEDNRQISARRKKRQKIQGHTGKMKQLTSELIETCSKRDISGTVLPMLTMHMCNSKQGRNAMAKYIASDNDVVLPHGGTSKGAKSKARKSAEKIVNGVVTMLVKTPERASFRQILEKAQQTSINDGNSPPMTPRNPASHYSEAVLPQVGLQIANDETPEEEDSDEYDSEDDEAAEGPRPRRGGRKSRFKLSEQEVSQKLRRSSMTFKTPEALEKAVSEVKESLGDETIKHLRTSCNKNRERRPILAMVAHNHSRKAVNHALNTYICKNEWRLCQIHAKYPGILQPVKKEPIQRLRVDPAVQKKFIDFLQAPGHLQRSAYGQQLQEVLGGLDTVVIDKVNICQNVTKLTFQYLNTIFDELEHETTPNGEPIAPEEERCRCFHQKVALVRCMRKKGHEGRCAFTPKGAISESTIWMLAKSLTAGNLKSLSGLDDTKVLKGRDNFHCLRRIVNEFVDDTVEVQTLLKKIDDTEVFHKTDFTTHLQRHGSHSCNCLTCGFCAKGAMIVKVPCTSCVLYR
jgi:hypothetical protein